ncbi:Disks large-associated protein 3 [Nibea albiflora]|uniref:Disks large-associated protein 3 n=1 Tax=Nibea albiflora TaxID=240163 RepID=A0ACB7ET96_NIBAL|nr:Disks large-associated protein 3 [Nibea albiflora]
MTFAHAGASYARGSSRAYRDHASSSDSRDSIPAPIGRRARFKRSNSVTASVQADLDPEGFPGLSIAVPTQDKSLQFGCSFQRHSSEPESASQYTECHRTVHTQGQWAYREDFIQSGYTTEPCPADPRPHQHPHLPPRSHSPLPITSERAWAGTPSLEGPRSLPDSGRASPCIRDGEFFLRLLQTEVERMEGWCQNMEREAEENELPEEILELIRNAVGSAQMLMSQKVQQFFRLCQQSVDPSAYPQPTSQDLAGFWDLLQLNIEDVRVKFQDLQRLKDSSWRLPPEKKEDKKLPPPLPKKPAGGVSGSLRADSSGDGGAGSGGGGSGGLVVPRLGGHTLPIREKSLDLGDRQRTEARRRLLQTKRAASFRQNSATESADSIEIYIPEAQTRL